MTELPYIVDWSSWPVIVMTPGHGFISDEDFQACLDSVYEGLRTRSGPYVVINDLRRSAGATPKQRQMLAAYNERSETLAMVTRMGVAMVFESGVLRGMLTAVLWLRPPKCETRVFATVTEALAWGQQLAAKRAS